ncbi:phosphatidylinositol 4-kinase beta [Striga asiatica]|uniref:Phosphatidylinositol 4-kinase beta n=1 Tax=Striga asiatica TaxID=4170 RepID=A0A5A7PZB0_STRAF|nr:phosphatidylinositol 4-kinase beta [Striga asiatica]
MAADTSIAADAEKERLALRAKMLTLPWKEYSSSVKEIGFALRPRPSKRKGTCEMKRESSLLTTILPLACWLAISFLLAISVAIPIEWTPSRFVYFSRSRPTSCPFYEHSFHSFLLGPEEVIGQIELSDTLEHSCQEGYFVVWFLEKRAL